MKNRIISLEGDVEASVYLEPSFSELQNSLAGKQKGEVEALLLANPVVARFKLSLWPFWMTVVPQDPSRLDVSLKLDH
jgi:hypothetical protein